MNDVKVVLEPSCGSCEYILRLESVMNNIKITGIELNTTIFNFAFFPISSKYFEEQIPNFGLSVIIFFGENF